MGVRSADSSRHLTRSKTLARACSVMALAAGIVASINVAPASAASLPVNGIGAIACSGATGTLSFALPLSSSGPASSDTATVKIKFVGCSVPGGNVTTSSFDGKATGTVVFPTQQCTTLNATNAVSGSLAIVWTGKAGKAKLNASTLAFTSLTGVQSGQNGNVGFTFTHQTATGSFGGPLSGELDSNASAATFNGTGNHECHAPVQAKGVKSLKVVAGSLATGIAIAPEGSCEGAGSLAAQVTGTSVVAYVPKGNWQTSTTGIDVVSVEGASIHSTTIPTDQAVNSCASNSITGQTVCVSNGNEVYVLKGTGLDPSVPTNPLSDSASGNLGFSGGGPSTVDVSMDATHNRALIPISVGGTGGFQFLNLATDTFSTPITTQDPFGDVSEDPLIDPVHNLILSASEDNNFEAIDVTNSASPQFYENPIAGVSGELDSTSEDCSTGIVLAPAEFSDPSQVAIADISNAGTAPEAVFTPGSPGSWAAPEQVQSPAGSSLSAGPSGSAVAQGTDTGVISGEFGGDGLTEVALPTDSGNGAVPAISSWNSCEVGNGFSMGDDPHTLTAYQSPNSGDAIALLADGATSQLAVVDLTQMLNPTAVPSSGNVCTSGTLPSGVEKIITLP